MPLSGHIILRPGLYVAGLKNIYTLPLLHVEKYFHPHCLVFVKKNKNEKMHLQQTAEAHFSSAFTSTSRKAPSPSCPDGRMSSLQADQALLSAWSLPRNDIGVMPFNIFKIKKPRSPQEKIS